MTATETYNTRAWRNLPRDGLCVIAELFAGECAGPLHRHHVEPISEGGDPLGRTVLICEKHHPTLERVARMLRHPEWKNCPHKPGTHVYDGAREACEANLNKHLLSV